FATKVQGSHTPFRFDATASRLWMSKGFVYIDGPTRRPFPEATMTIEQIIDFATATPASEHYLPAAEKIISGNPQQSVRSVYASPCSQFQAGTWKGEPGEWKVQYTEHEYCEILAGRSVITDQNGNRKELIQGDRFVI